MYQMLKFRRQFLLTRSRITSLADWKCWQIEEYYLYAHPDLAVTQVDDRKKTIVLLGHLFDSAEPEKGDSDIMQDILADAHSFARFVLSIKKYAGNFAMIYKNETDTFMLNDALALREIYYCTKDSDIVCGSQPNLVANFATPAIKATSDPDLLEFYTTHLKDSKWNPRYKWIGDDTYYDGIKHLLPNHYIEINRCQARRYWPNEPIKPLNLEEAVLKCCSFLQGVLRAMAHRQPVMMAVTAGTDSRTLLAASKELSHEIYYFVNDNGLGSTNPDISIPRQIFKALGIPFHVHDVPTTVDDEFRRIFLSNTFFATDRILPTIYNVYFKILSERVNILGIGEIGRTRFGKVPNKLLNSYRMVYKLGYKEGRYVLRQGDQILAELLPVGTGYGLNVLTLFYWEHMLGNWGATGNSESDIAIEEINPMDSHQLYECFLGVDDKYTKYDKPILFREMIRYMWPELLEWPINPPYTFRGRVIKYLKEIGVFELLKELKYRVNHLTHLYKARV